MQKEDLKAGVRSPRRGASLDDCDETASQGGKGQGRSLGQGSRDSAAKAQLQTQRAPSSSAEGDTWQRLGQKCPPNGVVSPDFQRITSELKFHSDDAAQ